MIIFNRFAPSLGGNLNVFKSIDVKLSFNKIITVIEFLRIWWGLKGCLPFIYPETWIVLMQYFLGGVHFLFLKGYPRSKLQDIK